MKKLNKVKIFSLIAFFCFTIVSVFAASSAMAWYNGGEDVWTWQYRKPIVIQGSQVDDSVVPVVVENGGFGTSSNGTWNLETADGGNNGDYFYNWNEGPSSWYSWKYDFPGDSSDTKTLEVSQWWTHHWTRASDITIELIDADGVVATVNNQDQDDLTMEEQWNSLGTQSFRDFAEVKMYGVDGVVTPTIEAESGTITAPMTTDVDGSITYIHTLGNTTSLPPQGFASYSVNIPEDGQYMIIGNINGASNQDDSFYFRMDGDPTWRAWGFFPNDGTWAEDPIDYGGIDPYLYNLTAGVHTLEFGGRENGSKLDYFYLAKTDSPSVSADAVRFTDTAAGELEDFVMLFNTGAAGDSDLAANLIDTTGGELVFTHIDPSDGIEKKLEHEVEKYESANGELVAWIKIPSLTSADKTIYMYYNAAVFDQWNPEGVWDSNDYLGVWHLGEDDANLTGEYNVNAYRDSTSNNNDGDDMVYEKAVPGRDGQIGRGQEFGPNERTVETGNNRLDDYIFLGDEENKWWLNDKSYTLETWFNADTPIYGWDGNRNNWDPNESNCWGVYVSQTPEYLNPELSNSRNLFHNWFGCNASGDHPASGGGFYCRMNSDDTIRCLHEGENDRNSPTVPADEDAFVQSGAISKNAWHHMLFTVDQSSKIATLYIDGVKIGSDPFGVLQYYSGYSDAAMYLGGMNYYDNAWVGSLDEMKIANVSRSAGWTQTNYRNQNNPSSFYNVQPQESNPDVRPADVGAPARSNGLPSGDWPMPESKSDTIISLETNEDSICKYSTDGTETYDEMTNIFYTSMSGLQPEINVTVNGFSDQSKEVYIKRFENPDPSDPYNSDDYDSWSSNTARVDASFFTGQGGLPYHIAVQGDDVAGDPPYDDDYYITATLTNSGSAPGNNIIINDGDAETSSTGSWNTSTWIGTGPDGDVDTNYNDDMEWSNTIGATYSWETTFPGETKDFDVYQWWSNFNDGCTQVSTEISDLGGTRVLTGGDLVVDQWTSGGGNWSQLGTGTFTFTDSARVTITVPDELNGASNCSVNADTVQFSDPAGTPDTDMLALGTPIHGRVNADEWDYYRVTAWPQATTPPGRNHYAVVSGLDPTPPTDNKTYYVKCEDEEGNQNTTNYEIAFTVSGIKDGGVWQHNNTYDGVTWGAMLYKNSRTTNFDWYSGFMDSAANNMGCARTYYNSGLCYANSDYSGGTVPCQSQSGACTTNEVFMIADGGIFADVAGSYEIDIDVWGGDTDIEINNQLVTTSDPTTVDLMAGWNNMYVEYEGSVSHFEIEWSPPWRTSSQIIPPYYLTPQKWKDETIVNIPSICPTSEDPTGDRCASKVDYIIAGTGAEFNPDPTIEVYINPDTDDSAFTDFPTGDPAVSGDGIGIDDLNHPWLTGKAYVIMMYEEDMDIINTVVPYIENNNLPTITGATCGIDGQPYSNPYRLTPISISPRLVGGETSRAYAPISPCLIDTGSTTDRLSFSFSDVQGRGGIAILLPFIYPETYLDAGFMSKGFVRLKFAATSGYHKASTAITFDVDSGTEKLTPSFMIDDGETKAKMPTRYRPNYVVMAKGNSTTTPKPGPYDIIKNIPGAKMLLPEQTNDPNPGDYSPIDVADSDTWYLAMGREGEQFDVVSSNYVANRAYGGYVDSPEGLIADEDIAGQNWVAFQYYGSNLDPDAPMTSGPNVDYNIDGVTDSGESGYLAGGGVFTVDAKVPTHIALCEDSCFVDGTLAPLQKGLGVGEKYPVLACLYDELFFDDTLGDCKQVAGDGTDISNINSYWDMVQKNNAVSLSPGLVGGFKEITGETAGLSDTVIAGAGTGWTPDSMTFNVSAGGTCGSADGGTFCTSNEVSNAGRCLGISAVITDDGDPNTFTWTCGSFNCSATKRCTLNKSWKEVAP